LPQIFEHASIACHDKATHEYYRRRTQKPHGGCKPYSNPLSELGQRRTDRAFASLIIHPSFFQRGALLAKSAVSGVSDGMGSPPRRFRPIRVWTEGSEGYEGDDAQVD
jgi:hypothetical protein